MRKRMLCSCVASSPSPSAAGKNLKSHFWCLPSSSDSPPPSSCMWKSQLLAFAAANTPFLAQQRRLVPAPLGGWRLPYFPCETPCRPTDVSSGSQNRSGPVLQAGAAFTAASPELFLSRVTLRRQNSRMFSATDKVIRVER